MFKTQCKFFYDEGLTQQDEMIPGEKNFSPQTVALRIGCANTG